MSQQVQKLFNAIAPRYDLLNSLLSLKIDQKWRAEAVNQLRERGVRRVLDLCAGTLALTQSLLKVNLECRVTAIDFSEPMLETGRGNLPTLSRSRVDCIVADVMEWSPLVSPPALYDAVMCAYGMRNVDDNERVLRKILSFLKPGGRLVILEFFRPEGILSQLFNLTYAELVIPALGRLVSKHPHAYQYLRDSVRNFYTATAYRELLKSIGYDKVTVTPQTGGISHLITAETRKRK